MTKRFWLLLFPLCLVLAHATPPFAQTTSDLKPDPAARFGTLPNGMAYVIMENHEPKGRASLRLLVNAGSLNEEDNQQGLAHFLEHLAFNGSRHYPPGTLIEFFQHNGMNFGGDTNAYTAEDHTSYQLELPNTKPETVEKALTLFADYGDGLLLEAKSIEKERNIIQSERRAHDSAERRVWVAENEFILGTTRIPKRIPIGDPAVVTNAQRERFQDFYDKWYRPDNMTAILVGDFNADEIEKQVVRLLSAIQPHGRAGTPYALGKIPDADGVAVRYFPEPDAKTTKIAIESLVPFVPPPDMAAFRLRQLARDVALGMFNRRLAILAKQEGAPFFSASANVEEAFRFYRNAGIEVTCQPAQWNAALGIAERELRCAIQFGFQPAELKAVIADSKNGLEQAVRTASTRRSPELADEIQGSVHDRRVFTDPATDRALFLPALEKLTTEQCTDAFRALWNESKGRYVFVAGNLTLKNPQPEIIAALAQSEKVRVAAPDKLTDLSFAYTTFGRVGVVLKRTHIDDLDVTEVEFGNGVRLNLKHTDFQANSIALAVRVGGGLLTAPQDKPGLSVLGNMAFISGGLGRHSADDLQRLLAGRTVGLNFGIGGDAFTFTGGTNRDDLLLECQLLAAHLTDPGFRPEAMRQASKGIEQTYTGLKHSVEGPFNQEVPLLLAGGDSRFGLPDRKAMDARTLAELKEWLALQFARGPVEIAVVGDLDVEATIAAVAQTFGALRPRDPKPDYLAERKVQLPLRPIGMDFRVETTIPKGLVALYWPAADATDVKRARRLNLLSLIFSDRLRMRIREQLGSTYSAHFGYSGSDTFTGYGFLSTQITVEPSQTNAVADAVLQIAADLHANGVTEDELVRAKLPLLTSLKENARTNGYWLMNVLAKAQEKPEAIDWCRTRFTDNEGITSAELNAYAQRYLGAERLCRFNSLPIVATSSAQAPRRPSGTAGESNR